MNWLTVRRSKEIFAIMSDYRAPSVMTLLCLAQDEASSVLVDTRDFTTGSKLMSSDDGQSRSTKLELQEPGGVFQPMACVRSREF
jgi:hypothetical protein